jgi:drug/metabolite transporter (DMT)-like permease
MEAAMHVIALTLVVCGAVVHAFWNIIAKTGPGGPLFVWAYSTASALIYLPIAVWAMLATSSMWTPLGVAAVLMSGVLHLGYALALQGGYGKADLSIVYPVARGTGPALSVIGAIVLLGEPCTWPIVIGTAVVVIGVYTVGVVGRAPDKPIWSGVRWGALTGLFIASYTLNDGAAVKLLGVSPIIIDYFGNVVRVLLLTPVTFRSRHLLSGYLHNSYKSVLGVAVLIPIPYLLALYAMTLTSVSMIAPARELSMMAGVVFSRFLLEEPNVSTRFVGAGMIAVGVAMLALG